MENNNKGVIALLIVIIIILTVLCVLFATKTISFNGAVNDNKPNAENKPGTDNNDTKTIKSKLVNNLICSNSNTTFNGITVNLEQINNDGNCSLKTFTINDKDIKNDISSSVTSYEIYDNNVIILSGDNSGLVFTIYSLSTNSTVVELQPSNLNGYFVTSYTTNNNIITINGKECGEQCGNQTTGYAYATFEIEYLNNNFSNPKLISHSN